ncbi:DUF2062 domain-containing protein [Sulfurospirillum arcachonense]|uniref:DUF2062 domain-containing protein n=1 Tax=Sulfurospirillum arcachonense TaxID=57666 RepID=UPI0004688D22|nr:DUF2062 domain-containing protein [Sulfurospirillum arcachonense]
MIRRVFKRKNKKKSNLDSFIKKYNIPREYLSSNRKATTRGLLVGIFWGFIPMPFQMLAVVAMIPFFKFNIPIAFTAVWLSNPITMPFMYYMEYITGSFILGSEVASVELTMQWFENNLSNIFIPLYLGTLVYAIGVSTFTYFTVNWLWIHSVKKEKRYQKRKDNKKQ